MYAQRFVRKRFRRIAVAIAFGVSATVVGTFSIVAFLGRFVGTFTVSLDNTTVELALSERSTFDQQSSFLQIGDVPSYGEWLYSSLPSNDVLDSEESTSKVNRNPDTGEAINLSYFKYTFYVKNVGETPAQYTFQTKILESHAHTDGRKLDDTLRLMLFENNPDEHTPGTVYAKRRNEPYDDGKGNVEWRTPISDRENQSSTFHGYATLFESESVICTKKVIDFAPGDMKRYTLVTWLDGNDPDSRPDQGKPSKATIRLGVEITAYEN